MTTVGNTTLNNNYRVALIYRCHIVDSGTVVNLPRARLNVFPNFNNAIHDAHIVNVSGTLRLVTANAPGGPLSTLGLNLISTAITTSSLRSTTVSLIGGYVSNRLS